MANAFFDKGREKWANGQIAWLADNIKLVLIAASEYTVNLATHEFLSSVPEVARVATSSNLSGKTCTGGILDADDVILPEVVGASCASYAFIKDTGDPATSPLLIWVESAAGLPVLPNGGDLKIAHDNGSNKIAKL